METGERHGRPKPDYVRTLRKADRHDYYALVRTVVDCLLSRKDEVIIASSYLTKFPSDFPGGRMLRKEGLTDYRKFKVSALLKWLHANGHINVTPEELRVAQISFSHMEKGVLNGHL